MRDSRIADPPHADSAVGYWRTKAAVYDDLIRRVVPSYEEMTERLLETVPAWATRVLELGCGTGHLSLRLAEQLPAAALTLVDAAPEMLEITRLRLAQESIAPARIRLVQSTFEELHLEPEAYDLVVASISLHHVADLASIYHTLRRGLVTGGALRTADGLAGATPTLHAQHMQRWAAFWVGRMDDDEIVSVRDHVERHDHYFDLATHVALLEAAGFTGCDCTWRDGLFAVLVADADSR